MTQAVLKELDEAYGPLVTRTHIPVSSALARAQMEGVPVFDFDPAATGATAYQALAGEVLSRFGVGGAAAA
jgi:cellulose biosynthesis protein BcsQ